MAGIKRLLRTGASLMYDAVKTQTEHDRSPKTNSTSGVHAEERQSH